MPFQGDPHRTLGIPPGATLNEIRSAYRRLAKKYHPDAAGERALQRFLAIQAAYEQLVDGEGRLRAAAPGGSPPARQSTGGARASRDAWRARRAAGTRTAGNGAGAAGPGPGGAPGGAGRERAPGGGSTHRKAGTRPSGSKAGSAEGPGGRRPTGDGHRGRRGSRTATPGSTTYDEAVETPLDPAWDGGSWYGAASGTYWTLNPREYADPRKHGPEYEARAWRAVRVEAGIDPAVDPGVRTGVEPGDAGPDTDSAPPDEARPDEPGT